MSYLIYHKETTKIHSIIRNRHWQDASYKTEAAAKAGLKREARLGKLNPDEMDIAEARHFHDNIEKTKVVKNLLNGKEVTLAVNTPRCCDPSSELYWSI